MDGASKFVRGDAIAGILIMVINLVGGLIIGMAQHDLSLADAAKTYTLLTIGDGLVAQVPALVISTAAGVTVSRVATDQDVGQQLIAQLFSNPQVLFLAAGVLGLLGLVPGMPNFVFLFFTAALAGLGWWLRKGRLAAVTEQASAPPREATTRDTPEASWDDVHLVDPLGLEVGYRLISLVDAQQGGELLGRIKGVRKKFAQDVGFLPPVIHIRDNLEYQPHQYRLALDGVEIGHGEAFPGQWLAINPGQATGDLEGRATEDPAFGLPAIWIEDARRDQAEGQGYTVVDASTVIATHINQLLSEHAGQMLGRAETQALLDRVKKDAPALVDDVVPKAVSLASLTMLLQNLLDEDVSIRDMRRILDVLAARATETADVDELTAAVRVALGRAIVQHWFGSAAQIDVMGLASPLEQMLIQALTNGGGMEPGLADTLMTQTQQAMARQQERGAPIVLVVQHELRPLLSRFLRRRLRGLAVLSQYEIPDSRALRMTTLIGGRGD